MIKRKGIGGHQSARMKTSNWLTPPDILAHLGKFDLDPCAAIGQPWRTAETQWFNGGLDEGRRWFGRVWLNPPYGLQAAEWLKRLAEHDNGIAIIFARTETKMFFDWVWERASAILFIRGRLHFYRPDGTRAKANAGAPSVLVAYGDECREILRNCDINGWYVDLQRN